MTTNQNQTTTNVQQVNQQNPMFLVDQAITIRMLSIIEELMKKMNVRSIGLLVVLLGANAVKKIVAEQFTKLYENFDPFSTLRQIKHFFSNFVSKTQLLQPTYEHLVVNFKPHVSFFEGLYNLTLQENSGITYSIVDRTTEQKQKDETLIKQTWVNIKVDLDLCTLSFTGQMEMEFLQQENQVFKSGGCNETPSYLPIDLLPFETEPIDRYTLEGNGMDLLYNELSKIYNFKDPQQTKEQLNALLFILYGPGLTGVQRLFGFNSTYAIQIHVLSIQQKFKFETKDTFLNWYKDGRNEKTGIVKKTEKALLKEFKITATSKVFKSGGCNETLSYLPFDMLPEQYRPIGNYPRYDLGTGMDELYNELSKHYNFRDPQLAKEQLNILLYTSYGLIESSIQQRCFFGFMINHIRFQTCIIPKINITDSRSICFWFDSDRPIKKGIVKKTENAPSKEFKISAVSKNSNQIIDLEQECFRWLNLVQKSSGSLQELKKVNVYDLKLKEIQKIEMIPNPEYVEDVKDVEEPQNETKHTKKSQVAKFIKHLSIKKETEAILVNNLWKDFSTLYLKEHDQQILKGTLQRFKTKKNIYKDLGLTYKFSALLHGPPGTGKTSTIQAIASYLNRDIYYLDLTTVKTNDDLKLLFDYVNKEKSQNGIIVMEDIDCMTRVVHQRTQDSVQDNPQLTLECFLNLLQGTLTADGSIFIATTNYINKLDSAFTRDGRFDIKLNLEACDHHQMQCIYQKFFNRSIPEELIKQIPENKITPATFVTNLLPFLLVEKSDYEMLKQYTQFELI